MSKKTLTPKDPALMPPSDTVWQQWYDGNKTAQAILNELVETNQCLHKALLPEKVIHYGHWIGAKLAGHLGGSGIQYSQLRRFVDGLKDLLPKSPGEQKRLLKLFQIHLVHGYSRKPELEPFYIVVKGIIGNNTLIRYDGSDAEFEEDFMRLMDLVDSITAYFSIMEKENNA